VEFRKPKFASRFWRVAEFTSIVPVPEAAIDEERDIQLGKNEVGLAEHTRISPPAGYSVLPKQRDHSQFRVAISTRANARHNKRPFLTRENICHLTCPV